MEPIKNKSLLSSLSGSILAGQSILDIFVLQGILDLEDSERIKSHFKTNREIENFLLKNHLVTRETINKAYSILLKMPYISLRNVEIPEKTLRIVPEKFARKFGIVPFNSSDNIIRIAVSNPSDLLVRYPQELANFFQKRNFAIELFITGQKDFEEAVKQYNKKRRQTLLVTKGSLPVVYLRNQTISDRYLKRLPKNFISQYRIVVFGQNHAGEFLVACQNPDSSIVRKIIAFIEKENNIKAELFTTSKEDIDYILKYYDGRESGLESRGPESSPEGRGDVVSKETVEKDDEKPKAKGSEGSVKEMIQSLLSQSRGPDFTMDERPDYSKFGKNQASSELAEEIAKTDNKTGESEVNKEGGIEKDKLQPNKADKTVKQDEENMVSRQETENDSKDKSTEEKKLKEIKAEEASSSEADSRKSTLDNQDLDKLLGGVQVRDEKTLESVTKDGYIPKIIAALIDFSLNRQASDIHLEPSSKIIRVRCRIDGILKEVLKLPVKFHPPMVSRVKILSKLKIDETRIPQDGRFGLVFQKREVDVRVSTMPTVYGEKIVLRILDKAKGVLSLEDLGMQGSAFDGTVGAIGSPYGIILSTGPTGSGKSTTLYAIINRVNVGGVNIITLEDPVEYEIAGVNQCQVKPEIGFTFASGLRSVLRQDPNIIMVGEIRDAETAGMATHAALTGHLVLSTLHTNDAAGALPRLINMGVEAFLITSAINLVIAQRLVRRVCPKCKEEMRVPEKLLEQIQAELNKISPKNIVDRARIPKEMKLYYGKGCNECSRGFKGRVGIFEVITITPEIEDLAVANRPANEIKETAIKQGMITMKQDGIIKALQGITTIDEVLQATMEH